MSFWDILSMLGSLALIVLVLVLTYVFTRWYARRMGGAAGMGKHIQVLERTAMGAGTSLVIAQVGDKYYLLGIGDKSISLLAELPEEFGRQAAEAQSPPPASFSRILRQISDRYREINAKKDDGGGNDGE